MVRMTYPTEYHFSESKLIDRFKAVNNLPLMFQQLMEDIARPRPCGAIVGTVDNHDDLGIGLELGFANKIVNTALKMLVFHHLTF